MSDEVSEQMSAILGFVVFQEGGEYRLKGESLRNPPVEDSIVEVVFDDATDELVIRLVPVDSAG